MSTMPQLPIKKSKRWHRLARPGGEWVIRIPSGSVSEGLHMEFRSESSLSALIWTLSRRYVVSPSVTLKEIPEGSEGEAEGCRLKRSVDEEDLEPIQSPQKKFKNIESNQDMKKRAAERLRQMSIREICLMVERAIYAEEEFEELPVEYQVMWEYLEEVS
ncbi:hypothetical protein PS1_019202 [Malus domestica]